MADVAFDPSKCCDRTRLRSRSSHSSLIVIDSSRWELETYRALSESILSICRSYSNTGSVDD